MQLTPRTARENSREYAIREITDNIVSLQLKPGTLLSENELAAEMGISRTPVREALIELLKTQIVEVLPQRGSRIAYVNCPMLDESTFIRRTLECAIVRAAAKSDAQYDFAALDDNIARQKLLWTSGDHEAMRILDKDFHKSLFELTGNMSAYNIIDSLLIHIYRIQTMSFEVMSNKNIVTMHSDILDAVKNHDADKAEQLMAQHINFASADMDSIKQRYPDYFK